ncbi:MAG TPA: HAD hydrolase-like protein [Candidatus Acidoferrales bacterium]|nr:HAD hydrolase-like protein [Candidatus Acidoferrales bacterium]
MALADLRVVFIDDGGVLNDNERRAPQWRRLLSEYLPPRLGGTPEAWAEANRPAFDRSWSRYMDRVRTGPARGIHEWIRADRGAWLVDMCERVGVAPPPDPVSFAVETSTWVSERVRAEIPGAVEAVRQLSSGGMVLHMASGGLSWELDPYLRGMGIRHLFERLYGPDLVDTTKNGPGYYAAIIADSGTDPAGAVVVEDSTDARGWAASVGLRAFPSLRDLLTEIGGNARMTALP